MLTLRNVAIYIYIYINNLLVYLLIHNVLLNFLLIQQILNINTSYFLALEDSRNTIINKTNTDKHPIMIFKFNEESQ